MCVCCGSCDRVDASARVGFARGAENRSRGSNSAGSRVTDIRRRPLRCSAKDQGAYYTSRFISETILMKKSLRETQTLRAGCSKAEPKIFAPPQTPFPGAQDSQNLISWRRSTTFTYRPNLVRIDAHNFELSWQQTHKHTQTKNPQTGPITIHCAAKLSAQCN